MSEPLVLAVDGGNSKTDLALVDAGGRVLATRRAGPFEPQSDGVGAAVEMVRRAAEQSGMLGAEHVVAYVAGADLPVEEEALATEFAARGLGADVVVRNDTFALLRAGASRPWGVAVVCGTGINAVGVSPTGALARFPALGRLSGDWGGGQDLADEMLWSAVRAEDGRGPATALSRAVTEHFGTATVEEVVLGLQYGGLDPASLHRLSTRLFAVAGAGDAVALALVCRLAAEIAVMAEVCLRRLELLETPAEVVLGGGVVAARDPLLTRLLDAELAVRAPKARPVISDVRPIVGAALGGLDRMGAPEAAKERLRAYYAALRD
ncbi:N-acetylglucosamine kinase [Nonomuraea longicatena]|uniref:BadF/BadG/BcrA/BcrD ATPase family protein n=1 Tax=Nonomuraea longicatena TaxID=83682 RepID=A0ABN1NY57_9ACTN